MPDNIVVYGAGAIGSQVAGRMHGAGHNVTVVEPWDAQRDAIRNGGITVNDEPKGTSDGPYSPNVIAPNDLSSLGSPIDVLFIAMKSYDTMTALEAAKPHLSRDSLIVSMQNSINEEWIAPVVGRDRTLGGVILINAVLLEPGAVTLTASVSRASASHRDLPGVYVGEYQAPAGDNAKRIAGLLNSVWPAVPVDDLLHERWSKLVNNTMMNTVTGITGLRSAVALATPEVRKLAIRIAAEALRVAEAEGHPLPSIMGDYAADDIYAGAEGSSSVVDDGLAARASLVSPGATTSMLQDVLRGRKTEADYFSGLIAKKGTARNIPTPFCSAATEVAHRVEAGLKPDLANVQEVFRLVGE